MALGEAIFNAMTDLKFSSRMLYDGLGYLVVLTGLSLLSIYRCRRVDNLSGINVLNLILYKTSADIQVKLTFSDN